MPDIITTPRRHGKPLTAARLSRATRSRPPHQNPTTTSRGYWSKCILRKAQVARLAPLSIFNDSTPKEERLRPNFPIVLERKSAWRIRPPTISMAARDEVARRRFMSLAQQPAGHKLTDHYTACTVLSACGPKTAIAFCTCVHYIANGQLCPCRLGRVSAIHFAAAMACRRPVFGNSEVFVNPREPVGQRIRELCMETSCARVSRPRTGADRRSPTVQPRFGDLRSLMWYGRETGHNSAAARSVHAGEMFAAKPYVLRGFRGNIYTPDFFHLQLKKIRPLRCE